MSPGTDTMLLDFGRQLMGQWGAGVVLLVIVAWKVGVFRAFGRMLGAEHAERMRLTRDQLSFIERLQEEITNHQEMIDDLRRWRREDREESKSALAAMRAECDAEMGKLHEQIAILIKGEARWRHLVVNLAQYIAALRLKLKGAGVDVVPFNGWQRFLDDGGTLPPEFETIAT